MVTNQRVTDQDKQAIWQAYDGGKPTRVPMMLWTNTRVVIQNPDWNPEGYTFEQVAHDPKLHVEMDLRWQMYCHTVLNKYNDSPTSLPDKWVVSLTIYNVYEAAYFGCPITYEKDQLPSAQMVLADDEKESVFDVDIEHPLENPFVKQCQAFWDDMAKVVSGMTYEGRPVELAPWGMGMTDGPVTMGCNLRGDQFLLDLAMNPDYTERFMAYITQAAIIRRDVFENKWAGQIKYGNGMADDSCAMLSPDMYRQQVMHHHRKLYDAYHDQSAPRLMHMCGNATHHFPTLVKELNVSSLDTGFPVDHGVLREQVGEDVEILGGPEVALLLDGAPDAVYARAESILKSGVTRGGRFVLREGNNLPPNVPEANLEAMYQACLDHGWYEQ